jgi:hypothetical protein
VLKGIQFQMLSAPILPAPGAPPGVARPEPVPREVAEAFVSAQITHAVGANAKSGFSLTFAFGKGSGLRRQFAGGFFDPPRRVVLMALINGMHHVLIDGVLTKHEVSASNDPGQSKLTVTGEDLSRLMDLIDFSWILKYPAMPAEARVAIILAKYIPLGVLPIIIPSVNIDIPIPTSWIPSHMGTDLQYLTYLANSVGYVFRVDPGPDPGISYAYWGPEMTLSAPQQALIVNSDAASNADSMTFTFDAFAKTLFVMLIRDEKLPIPIPIPIPDISPLSPPLGRRSPMPLQIQPLRGISHYNIPQALAIGLAKAARAAEVISGSGSLNVMRYGTPLKAGRLVDVKGAGFPHDGLHFVRSVTHSIKPGEYKQNFTLTRNAFEPLSFAGSVVEAALGTVVPALGTAVSASGAGPQIPGPRLP